MKENLMHIVKKDKKKLLILSVLAVAAVLLMVIGGRSGGSSEKTEVAEVSAADASSDPLSAADDLERVLSKMDGAGKVEVLIF